MPGRVASATAAPRAARKTTSTRSLRTARISSPVTDIPDEGEDSSLRRAVCQTFVDAQKSTAGHRKAIISLRKVQEACCYEPVNKSKGARVDDFEEEDFNREVVRCVLRILPVKKSEPVGDRVVRFLGTFLNVASGKDNDIAAQDGDADTDMDAVLPETPTSRLTTLILSTLLPLLQAKEKSIRFRATQATSHIINSLDTLDDSLFHKLRFALLKRIHDKEAPVRLQAVYGLGRLAAEVEDDEEEDSDSDDDVRGGVLKKLLGVLQNDPSAEVRRNLLLNLPLTKEVLPYLLERARDADATTRRALYSRLLPALGDFRHLSMTHREKLLRWGLRDRDENVRKATAKLFCERWIEDCAALPAAQAVEAEQEEDGEKKEAVPSLDALLELLERIDVVNTGREEGSIALIAMHEFWLGRPDYLEYVSFPDTFWEDLSPELAFVARTFNDFCRTSKVCNHVGPDLDVLAEEKLPEVTKFGFLLEREISKLDQATTAAAVADEEDRDEEDEVVAHAEFVVEQMLHMALTFDYSDEVGRRKMNALMSEALARPALPEEVTRLVVEVLRLVCGGDGKSDRDRFCSLVLEAIAEVHDTIMDNGQDAGLDSTEESFHSANSQVDDDEDTIVVARRKVKNIDPEAEAENAVRSIMVNMKCLHIAMCMLQNVDCELEENPHLVTMLNSLVVPAVRSQEAPIRERGMLCLGLCCLLGQNLAKENLTLFLHCFAKGHAELQAIALQIITDILITHPTILTELANTENSQDEPSDLTKPVVKAFTKSLKSDDASVQSTGAIALSKAMLSQLITDSDLLKTLVVTYFDPDSASNAQLRQSLSYFLPVYCHSRAGNAVRMAGITCSIISKLWTIRDALLDDPDEEVEGPPGDGMVKLTQVGTMLLDWTDPRKVVGFGEATKDASVAHGAGEAHFIVAESILERLVTSQVHKDERKVLFGMLGKLHFPAGGADKKLIESILELAAEAVETKAAPTATDRNALTKVQNSLLKLMHDLMTTERGGGGAEETVLESTELQDQTEAEGDTAIHVPSAAVEADDDDEEEDQDSDVTQIQQEMRDATLGTTIGFTTGVPDDEGTRIGLESDSEMMDVDG